MDEKPTIYVDVEGNSLCGVNPLVQEALHVRDLLDKAIVEKGEDYIYPRVVLDESSCNYLEYEDNLSREVPIGPGCLVGHVLLYDGVEMSELMGKEGSGAASVAPYSASVNTALGLAQQHQDQGHPWKEARQKYDEHLVYHCTGYAAALSERINS
jgi:hypothetical protein